MSFVDERELMRVANTLLDPMIGLDQKRDYLMYRAHESGIN
jgi:hypothetical protein